MKSYDILKKEAGRNYLTQLNKYAGTAVKSGYAGHATSISHTEIWHYFTFPGVKIPNQGWKIHLSFNACDAVRVFPQVVDRLIRDKVTFKIPRDLSYFTALNNGEFGTTQIGKIVTIYPTSKNHFIYLVSILDKMISLPSGPPIISDIRLKESSPLFYRYGVMTGKHFKIDENGTKSYLLRTPEKKFVQDVRNLDSLQPCWAPAIPFNGIEGKKFLEYGSLDGPSGFIPFSTIYKSPRGVLTVGFDNKSGQLVVEKRVYDLIGADCLGNDSRKHLGNEFAVLKTVLRKVNVPRVMNIARGGNFTNLYIEYLDGNNFEQIPPESAKEYLGEAASQLHKLHVAGYAHHDIKLPNIFLSNQKVFLTDFELAAPLGKVAGGWHQRIYKEGQKCHRNGRAGFICLGHLHLQYYAQN
jgi:hypothetical protein